MGGLATQIDWLTGDRIPFRIKLTCARMGRPTDCNMLRL
jgi:hypothetical protein